MQKLLFIFSACIAIVLFLLPYLYDDVKAALTVNPVIDSARGEHIQTIAAGNENRNFAGNNQRDKPSQIPVLLYHRVVSGKDLKAKHYDSSGMLVPTIVTTEQFRKQMNLLKTMGYTTLSLNEFEDYMLNQKPIPSKSVLITFDDGHKDNFVNAYPILKKNAQRAAVFLITSEIKRYKEDYNAEKLQFASISELEEGANVFDYGSHTHDSHQTDSRNVPYLISQTEEKIKEDVKRSLDVIGSNRSFAYPYGSLDEEATAALKEIGIKLAFTVKSGPAVPGKNLLEINRNVIEPTTEIQDFMYLIHSNTK